MTDESKLAAANQSAALPEYPEQLPRLEAKAQFRLGIESLLPPPIAPKKLVALFENRATYGAIQGWRFGRRGPPQWATELLDRKLGALAARLTSIRPGVRSAAGPGKAAGNQNIRAYHARRFTSPKP